MISVIIPNYNHAPYLSKRIESVLNQTYQDFELILMDDCSTDDSRIILESYKNNPKVSHIVYNTENSGSTFKQWQKGISLAKGDYIWIAESDDWAEVEMLEKLVDGLEKNTAIVFCRSLRAWEETDSVKSDLSAVSYIKYDGQDFIEKKMMSFNTIENASMGIFRKEMVDMKWFDEIGKLRYCGDWLFWIKLAEKGNVTELPITLNYFRQHGTKVTSKAKKLGLDFTEGVKVLRYIESSPKIQIPQSVIKYWAQVWVNTRVYFDPGVTLETLKSLLSFRLSFSYYISKDMVKKRYNTLRRKK